MIRVSSRLLPAADRLVIAAALVLLAGAAVAGPDEGRAALLVAAEKALASGHIEEAGSALETAAQMAHSADAELLQVRWLMQQGRYRQAMALAAHTAGDHREGLVPTALYAWVLALAGQQSIGLRQLDAAMRGSVAANAVADPIAVSMSRLISAPDTPFPVILLKAPHRFAPYAFNIDGNSPPASATAVGAGVLWDDGSRALVPLASLALAARIWVRNGLGETVGARFLRRIPGTELALLELAAPLAPGDARWALRDPFAGSPGFVADYPSVLQAAPAWPRVRHGFLGAATLSSPLRRLGITLAAGSQGGAVFDKFGHVAGVALATKAGGAVLITVSQLRNALGSSRSDASAQTPGAAVGFDEGYELAMRMTLQVISST